MARTQRDKVRGEPLSQLKLFSFWEIYPGGLWRRILH